MYPSLRLPSSARGHAVGRRGPLRRLQVSRNVVYLGLTSMFTDISSEMVNAVLPLYLTTQLGLGALAYGAFAGGYQGVTALGRLASGFLGDRHHRYKEIAAAGYGASVACKLGLLAAGGAAWPTAGVLYVDRVGKGVRSTPRDALISLSSLPSRLGEAFGVHRALDTIGAVLGPVLAFAVLLLMPHGYSVIFAISLVFAIIGLALLSVRVVNPPAAVLAERGANTPPRRQRVSLRSALRLVRTPSIGVLAVVAGCLGAATISDGFVYLAFQNRTGMNAGFFPLLYVGTSAAYLLLAVPLGCVADRLGRARVLVGGYIALLAVYVLLLVPRPGLGTVLLALVLFGSYYAATDGVLMAIGSAVLPARLRGSGLAMITTVSSTAQFVSSLAFGALWAARGPEFAVKAFGFVLVVVVGVAAVALPRCGATADQTVVGAA
jgi:MFS family permease